MIALLASPPLRGLLEASMVGHMLFQIPLLAFAGILAGHALPVRAKKQIAAYNAHGLPFTLLAAFISTYWMLPRALDAALLNPWAEAAKFASLPLLVGLPLSLSWRQLGTIGQGFVLANFISMVAVAGWLYIAAPVRVCNNYLVNQQTTTGWLLVIAACLSLFAWALPAFVSRDILPAHSPA